MVKLEVIVRSKENHKSHAKFDTYAVKVSKEHFGKNWIELRFTKDVSHAERPVSYSNVFVNVDDMHIDFRNAKYPVAWVKKIDHIVELERPKQDLAQYFESVEDVN